MKRVVILAAMHGDETYGIELFNEFIKKFPHLAQQVELIIGNELAYKKKVRFIDADMNRQYRDSRLTHESREIKRVEALLKKIDPDYIIDIHTTKRNSGIFFISDVLDDVRRTICEMLPYDVCIMHDPIIKKSFIGNHDNAVSLEYSLTSISSATTAEFVDALAKLIEAKNSKDSGKVYDVLGLISKDEWLRYSGLKNYDVKPEGIALMVPASNSEMSAKYYGFWCHVSPE